MNNNTNNIEIILQKPTTILIFDANVFSIGTFYLKRNTKEHDTVGDCRIRKNDDITVVEHYEKGWFSDGWVTKVQLSNQ